MTNVQVESDGVLSVTGWAVDRRRPTEAASVVVTIRTAGRRVEHLLGPAGERVEGLRTGIGGAGERHGFTLSVAPPGPGPAEVCAVADSVDRAPRTLGCRSVELAGQLPLRPLPRTLGSARVAEDSPLAALDPIQLNNNGAWSWFEDERAIFTRSGHLLVGSTAGLGGAEGSTREGDTDVAELDLRTGAVRVDTVHAGLEGDDHNSSALLELPGGRVVAAWSGHGEERLTRFARREADALTWEADAPVPSSASVTYNNLAYLSEGDAGRGVTYDFIRSLNRHPTALRSSDRAANWSAAGQLVSDATIGRPYVRYASDGRRRIHFALTDDHPRKANGNSVYHGYLEDGRLYRSDGTFVGPLGGRGLEPSDFTLVFRGRPGPTAGLQQDLDAWVSDLELDGAGRPVVAFSTRLPAGEGTPVTGKQYDHRYHRARWNGTAWTVSEVAYAGGELNGREVDYTGLVAVDPADADRLLASANVHPATNRPLVSAADGRVHYELFEGRTVDDGRTWAWSAVTRDSSVDNLRPIVPRPVGADTAVMWLRGTYNSYRDYDLEVVGHVDRSDDQPPPSPRSQAGPGQVHLAGDFDGDGTDDLFVYRPGPLTDAVLVGPASRRHRAFANVHGSYRPAVLDADGDQRDDILWYSPGPAADFLWRSVGAGRFRSQTVKVNGRYWPTAGDFDGDGYDDLFWASESDGGPSHLWWFTRGATWRSESRLGPAGGPSRPAAGDFDGDGRDDLAWNVSNGAERLWFGRADRRFAARPAPALDASALPTVGDLDFDGRADLVWHDDRPAEDPLWLGGAGGFDVEIVPEPPRSSPVLVDIDVDGVDDLYWYSPTSTDTLVLGPHR